MANFTKKITRTLKKSARKVRRFVCDTATVTKYSILLKAKDADLEEKYEELGKLSYLVSLGNDDSVTQRYNECLAEIEKLREEILEIRRKLAKARGEIVCTSCGSYVSPSKDICPSCGKSLARIEVDAPDAQEEPVETDEENNE